MRKWVAGSSDCKIVRYVQQASVSEIVGWQPAATDTKVLGLKGDSLNLNTDESITSNPDDRVEWEIGKGEKVEGGKKDKLSEIGHGQVPFMGPDAPAAAPPFEPGVSASPSWMARTSSRPTSGERSSAKAHRVRPKCAPGLRSLGPERESYGPKVRGVRILAVAPGQEAASPGFWPSPLQSGFPG